MPSLTFRKTKMNQAEKLKDTLNLPKTDFPMRANAVEREPLRLDHWESNEVYQKMQRKNKGKESFILHDGPPFTNGDVHVGTALNKTLKDVILRYKNAQGFHTPYVPGWDCHGLPIEHKVSKKLRKEKKDFDSLFLRQACQEFSNGYIETQRAQFKRLGILADWKSEYKTMNGAYEAEIIRTFAEFVKKGLVYRSKKPVYWSIPCRTALAEAEIEYKDHISPSIYVPFQLTGPDFETNGESSLVIWTTTPWTLPSNLALAVHPRETYIEILCSGKSYWVAEELVDSFASACELEDWDKGKSKLGSEMTSWVCQHPFIDRKSPLVPAEYVTTESGTGCVHIAPGHGLDDYITGLENNLEVYCPLDDNGSYLEDGQIPSRLVGVSVLEKADGSPANKEVLNILKESGKLLALADHHHQYPHCWRSKTPVVFRAMDQWFVSLDKDGLRDRCMDEVQSVNFTPDWGKNRIHGFLESRPDWCISRQRSWGVPIPVFYDEEGRALLDEKIILGLAEKIEKKGTDAWFSMSADELLEGLAIPDSWKGKALQKGSDTLDVWIDSGCSHRAVLKNNKDLSWPADLYLEGSDQHRGWFQSSLWTSMIAFGSAPYKRVLTHGFVVDGNGRKISKSDGKPQTADSYVKKYGADVLRIWVCSEDFRRDIPLSDEILGQVVRSYRTLRNSIKFQLGNLHDFCFDKNALPIEDLTIIDRWALAQTNNLVSEVTDAFEIYELHRGVQAINRFCSNVLSSTYHDIIKDRLYTLHPDDVKRRSTQTTLYLIFESLIRILGPMAPFTADEAWSFHKSKQDLSVNSLALECWPKFQAKWSKGDELNEAQEILNFKESKINECLEALRSKKEIGQSLEAEVEIKIPLDSPLYPVFKRRENDLAEIFIVSNVSLIEIPAGEEIQVTSRHATGKRCPRSWRWVPVLVDAAPWGEVSPRCAEVLAKLA